MTVRSGLFPIITVWATASNFALLLLYHIKLTLLSDYWFSLICNLKLRGKKLLTFLFKVTYKQTNRLQRHTKKNEWTM